MKHEFETGIAAVLEKFRFETISKQFAHSRCNIGQYKGRKIVASFVCYKQQDHYDDHWASQFPDRCKNVYWLQFRDDSNDKFEWMDCAFDHYIYAPSELEAFLNDWKTKVEADMLEWASNLEMYANDARDSRYDD